MASVFAKRVRATSCASGEPADGQPVASDSSTAAKLLTCKRGLQGESMWVAGEACTRGACVSSVLCTRVLVCSAQGSERGRGSGEAEAGEDRCAWISPDFPDPNLDFSRSGEIGSIAARGPAFLRAGRVLVRRRCYTLA